MADIKLRVTPEALKSKAIEVENEVKKLQTHFDSIQDIVARSTGYWVGSAGDKARKEFADKKDDTNTVIKRFREHPTDLQTMAGVYEGAERAVVSNNTALPVDVII